MNSVSMASTTAVRSWYGATRNTHSRHSTNSTLSAGRRRVLYPCTSPMATVTARGGTNSTPMHSSARLAAARGSMVRKKSAGDRAKRL